MADKVIYWSPTSLTGGGAGALDAIDGADLGDGDIAHVMVNGVLYIYLLDADSAASEASPRIIAPATNAGDQRWILQTMQGLRAEAVLSGTLTTAQCISRNITNYGQGASDTTVLVPSAFADGHFVVTIATAQAANDYILDLETGTDVWYLDGVALGAGKKIYIAAPTVGAALQFNAVQTGAATWQWMVYTIAGAWAAEA